MTQDQKPPSTEEGSSLAAQYAMFYPTQKVGNTKRRRTVMLISMSMCEKTKSGFGDTIEGYLDRNGITVIRLSNTVVAIVPDEKFVEGQISAIFDSVARYRNIMPSQLKRQRLSGSSASALRSFFEKQLPHLYDRLTARSASQQLVTDRSS